jgi:hypothetical protein
MARNIFLLLLLVLVSVAFVSCTGETDTATDEPSQPRDTTQTDEPNPEPIEPEKPLILSEDEKRLVNRSQVYANHFQKEFNTSEIRSFIETFEEDCSNRECLVSSLYSFVTENVTYYEDTRNDYNHRVPQKSLHTAVDVIRTRGGDHEDLALFFATVTESMGFPSYFALTEDHIYPLACDVRNSQRLQNALTLSLVNTYNLGGQPEDYSMRIEEGNVYLYRDLARTVDVSEGDVLYVGADGSPLTMPLWRMNLEYFISADDEVTVHVVTSARESQYREKGNDDFSYIETCKETGTEFTSECTKMSKNGGIIIEHDSDETIEVYAKLSYYYRFGTYEDADSVMQPYVVNDMNCFVAPFEGNNAKYLGAPALPADVLIMDPSTGELVS